MTRLSRTTHGIAYDTTHDEIIAPNPLAAAVVIFRGGAVGEEAPIRTIQGARSGLSRPETVAVDEKNNEIFVGDPGDRRVLVYKRDADGDAKPLRTIQGPKTKLLQVVGPETGKTYAAVINNEYLPPYDIDHPRRGLDPDVELPSPWNTGTEGFIGVWDDELDDGDAPPRSIIKGRSTGIVHPAGVTFNARDGEVIAPDAVWNGLFTFLKPELFSRTAKASQ